METIYSEADVTGSGMSWGEWKFSLSDDKILERISSFCPKREIVDPKEEEWAHLFSMVKESSSVNQSIVEASTTVNTVEEVPMESSNVCEIDNSEITMGNDNENLQDLSSFVVDVCNRLVPKLRLDLSAVQAESESVVTGLRRLDQVALISVMENAWSQLQSDESKLCFCTAFSSTAPMCYCLCKYILLPWLRVNHLSKLELLSSILSKQADTVCVNLIAPLLQTVDSPWVCDLPGTEELMSAMTVQQWNILLKQLLSELKELQEWQIPVLAAVVQKSEPAYQELHLLVQLMSSVSTTFDQNRDFGALVAAVASCLKPDSVSLGPQLKAIVNNFKGSLKVMKFKTLKIISDISD